MIDEATKNKARDILAQVEHEIGDSRKILESCVKDLRPAGRLTSAELRGIAQRAYRLAELVEARTALAEMYKITCGGTW